MSNLRSISVKSPAEISAILSQSNLEDKGNSSGEDIIRSKAISKICHRFIETEEDVEEIEYLLSFLQERRGSANSAAPSTTETDVSLTHKIAPGCSAKPGVFSAQKQRSSEEAENETNRSEEKDSGCELKKRGCSKRNLDPEEYRSRLEGLKLVTRPKSKTTGDVPEFLVALRRDFAAEGA